MSDYDPDDIDARFDELIRVSFGEDSVPHRHLSNRPPTDQRPADDATNGTSGSDRPRGSDRPSPPEPPVSRPSVGRIDPVRGPVGHSDPHPSPPRHPPVDSRSVPRAPEEPEEPEDRDREHAERDPRVPEPLPSPRMWSGQRMAGALMLCTGLLIAMLVVFGIQLEQPLPTLGGLLAVVGLALLLSGVSRENRDGSGPWDNGSRL